MPGGLAPICPNRDGLLPVLGNGHYEWTGSWRGDQPPSGYNPKPGYFIPSNEMSLSPDYPYRECRLGFGRINGPRHACVDGVLARPDKVSTEDLMCLQDDAVPAPACRLMALLAHLPSSDTDTQATLNLLKG